MAEVLDLLSQPQAKKLLKHFTSISGLFHFAFPVLHAHCSIHVGEVTLLVTYMYMYSL